MKTYSALILQTYQVYGLPHCVYADGRTIFICDSKTIHKLSLKEELTEAHRAIQSLLSKCEEVMEKFSQGTCQHTLLKNRITALSVALELITNALEEQKKDRTI